MLNRITKLAASILFVSAMATTVWGQAAPTWKDQGESDLGIAASKETNPAKQLDLLKQWEQKYPDSALKSQRMLMEAQAELAILGQAFNKPAGDPALAAGQKAGKDLEDHFEEYFNDSMKPATATADQWAAAKKNSAIQVHSILANIAQTNKDDATAEAEYKKVLEVDPTQAASSYYLGLTILREMAKAGGTPDPARYSEAIYDLARALAVTGPNALPAAGRTADENSLKKALQGYHGDANNEPDVIKQAANSALPPAGFHIESVVEIADAKQKNHDAWAKEHPELAFWETVKDAITAGGDTAFASVKDIGIPPAPGETYSGGPMLTGKVVSQTDKTITLNVDGVDAGDAVLKFDDNIKGTIEPGTELKFKGIVDSYTMQPNYQLTIVIQEPKTDITGLPADVKFVADGAAKKPAAAGRGPARGGAAPKTAPKKTTK